VPLTTGGKVIGLLLMSLGVVFFVGSTALFASVFSEQIGEDRLMESEKLTITEYRNVMAELTLLRAKLEDIEKRLP
jgi:hypothetical protein